MKLVNMQLSFTIITKRFPILLLLMSAVSPFVVFNNVNASISNSYPAAFSLSLTTSDYNGYSISCNGLANGQITVNVNGGTAPFIYQWNNGSSAQTISNLTAGYYKVIVTDNIGDIDSIDIILTEPPQIAININGFQDVLCHGDSNAFIDINAGGGVLPFSFQWSNGLTTEDLSTLVAGTYTVTVIDANGCNDQLNYTINEPDSLQLLLSSDTAWCGQANGYVEVIASGGTGALGYLWNTGAATSSDANLPAGIYTVTVTDAKGCIASDSIVVFDAVQPTILVNSVTDVNCFGNATGAIDINVAGGGSFIFQWSDGQTTEDAISLFSGSYTVTVTNQFGCTKSAPFVVGTANPIAITLDAINEHCGLNDGAIDLTASGGTGILQFLWSTGSTDANISNLSSGTYTVIVTDQNSCTSTASVNLSNLPGPLITLGSYDNETCYNSSDGYINITVNGGIPPYNYLWSNGSTLQNILEINAGTYTVTVSDSVSCQSVLTQVIIGPDSLQLQFNSIDDGCNHQSGVAGVLVAGGTLPYAYQWSNGGTNAVINNLSSGYYTVTITDINACSISDSVFIDSTLTPVIATNQVTDVLCNGDSTGSILIAVTGGNSFNFQWSNGDTVEDLTGLPSGIYEVTVTNDAGCTVSQAYAINQPQAIAITAIPSDATCNQNNGSITLSVSGGNSGYSFLWNDASTASILSNIFAGTYTVTVTDANSCTQSEVVNVSNASGPVITNVNATNVNCFGDTDGSINITVFGGTGTLQYLWSNGATTEDISLLSAGTYTLVVTDQNNCQTGITEAITEPSLINIQAIIAIDSCTESKGAINVIVGGGTAPFSYQWNNGSTNASISNLSGSTYTVTVTDANFCSQTDSFLVDVSPALQLSLIQLTDVTCFGGNDGSISVRMHG